MFSQEPSKQFLVRHLEPVSELGLNGGTPFSLSSNGLCIEVISEFPIR